MQHRSLSVAKIHFTTPLYLSIQFRTERVYIHVMDPSIDVFSLFFLS